VGASGFAKEALQCCTADTEIYELILFAFFHSLVYVKCTLVACPKSSLFDLWQLGEKKRKY
jgi:hypothetical protein